MKHSRLLTILALASLLFITCSAATNPLQQRQREETLAFRRIMTLWKENERDELKTLLQDFLSRFPRSELRDKIATMRAEIAFDEKDYTSAATHYRLVTGQRFRNAVKPHLLFALFHEKAFAELAQEVAPLVPEDYTNLTERTDMLHLYYHLEAERHLAKNLPTEAEQLARLRDIEEELERLSDTPFREYALRSLAGLNEDAGDLPRATQLWRMLAWSHPESRNEALFKAAALESRYDPEAAIDAFADLYASEGAEAPNALFNQVTLLFTAERYDEILALETEILKSLKPNQAPEAYLYLGNAHLEKNEYGKALTSLQNYLNACETRGFQDRQAVFSAAIAAYFHEDLEALVQLSRKLQSELLTDDQAGRLHMMQALLSNRQNQPATAYQMLQIIEQNYPELAKTDTLNFEKALALYNLRQWEISRNHFLAFIENHPKSHLQDEAWAYIVDASMRLMENMDAENPAIVAFADEVVTLAQQSLKVVNDDTDRLGTALIRLGRALIRHHLPDHAMEVLKPVAEEMADHPLAAQAHYFMAITEFTENNNSLAFIHHAEKTLELNPTFSDAERLHQELYTLYVDMAKNPNATEGLTQSTLLDKAANHLYRMNLLDEEAVPQPNKFWAANHYYRRAMDFTPADYTEAERPSPLTELQAQEVARRGVALYKSALNVEITDAVTPAITIERDTLYLEKELFHLARLLQMLDQEQQATAVLQNLRDQIVFQSDENWQMAPRVLLELSLACEKCGQCEDAICILKELVQEVRDVSPYMVHYARLQTARLSFLSVPEEHRTEKNPRVKEALQTLLELQTRRHIMSEPLHLEAAMDYALFRTSIEKPEKRDNLLLNLLTRAKRDFASSDTIYAQDYHEGRQQNSDQDFLYQTYNMLFDARIAQIKARLAKAKGKNQEALSQEKAAQDLFRMLTKEAFAVSRYLVDEAKQGLRELAEGNHTTRKADSGLKAEASTTTTPQGL